jgi:hypothetical protein
MKLQTVWNGLGVELESVDTEGTGKVYFVTAAPLGDASASETSFWDWPDWPKLMGMVIRDLL